MKVQPNPVNWFEIPVNDIDRAIKFYEAAFEIQLTPTEMDGMRMAFFPMERGASGASGSLLHCPPAAPSHHGTTVYFHVECIDTVLNQITKAGGKTLIPRKDIGQYGFIAQFEDIEGNRVALHEMPTTKE